MSEDSGRCLHEDGQCGPVYSNGMCRRHYERGRRFGDPLAPAKLGGPKFTPDALERAGITQRRLNHWHAKGYLNAPLVPPGNRRRQWTAQEVRVALLMARLLDAGIDLPRAAGMARNVVTKRQRSFELAEGLHLQVRELPDDAKASPF